MKKQMQHLRLVLAALIFSSTLQAAERRPFEVLKSKLMERGLQGKPLRRLVTFSQELFSRASVGMSAGEIAEFVQASEFPCTQVHAKHFAAALFESKNKVRVINKFIHQIAIASRGAKPFSKKHKHFRVQHDDGFEAPNKRLQRIQKKLAHTMHQITKIEDITERIAYEIDANEIQELIRQLQEEDMDSPYAARSLEHIDEQLKSLIHSLHLLLQIEAEQRESVRLELADEYEEALWEEERERRYTREYFEEQDSNFFEAFQADDERVLLQEELDASIELYLTQREMKEAKEQAECEATLRKLQEENAQRRRKEYAVFVQENSSFFWEEFWRNKLKNLEFEEALKQISLDAAAEEEERNCRLEAEAARALA